MANISGKYKTDLSDWEYLCRRCHMKKDGRLIRMGRYPSRGEFNGRAKANWEIVNKIRREIRTGATQSSLSKKYELSTTTINKIVRNITWAESKEER